MEFGEIKKSCFALSPQHKTKYQSVYQEIKESKFHTYSVADQDEESRLGGRLPPALGRREGECGVNVGSPLSAVSQLYRPSGTADMRRAETTAMT